MNYLSTPPLPKGVRIILIATVAAWCLEIIPVVGRAVVDACALWPIMAVGQAQIWRFFTYLFLHDPHSPMHILFNMLALWMFGVELEELWGTKRFLTFYCIAGVGAGLFGILTWAHPIIGASGAILALLTVYAMYFPDRQILMFFIFPMPVRYAVLIIGAISLWGAATGAGNVAYLTHLGGILIGFLYVKYYDSVIAWYEHRARARKNQSTILEFRKKTAPDPKKSFDDEIDPILKKISEQGMASLTDAERKKLMDASKKRK
jgi:membrane associated rhomboid family serine protease